MISRPCCYSFKLQPTHSLSAKYSQQNNVISCSKGRVSLLSQATSNSKRQHSLRLHQGRFMLDIRKNMSTERVAQALEWTAQGDVPHWTPSLEAHKKQADIALSAMVQLTKQRLAKGWT